MTKNLDQISSVTRSYLNQLTETLIRSVRTVELVVTLREEWDAESIAAAELTQVVKLNLRGRPLFFTKYGCPWGERRAVPILPPNDTRSVLSSIAACSVKQTTPPIPCLSNPALN